MKPASIFFSEASFVASSNICTARPRLPSLNCSVAALTRWR